MPLGDVRLREFATSVETQLGTLSVFDQVDIVDADPDDIESLRKNMGRAHTNVARVSYDPEASVEIDSALGKVSIFQFGLIVTVLHRTMGSSLSRLGDGSTTDVTTLVKAAMNGLEGKRLSLLNSSGISCGPARYRKSGDSLQIMQFRVTGQSRESRS